MPVRLLYLLFRDFLLNSEKREEHPFWINEKNIHKTLATRYLSRLSLGECLKKDICNLRILERLRANISK